MTTRDPTAAVRNARRALMRNRAGRRDQHYCSRTQTVMTGRCGQERSFASPRRCVRRIPRKRTYRYGAASVGRRYRQGPVKWPRRPRQRYCRQPVANALPDAHRSSDNCRDGRRISSVGAWGRACVVDAPNIADVGGTVEVSDARTQGDVRAFRCERGQAHSYRDSHLPVAAGDPTRRQIRFMENTQ